MKEKIAPLVGIIMGSDSDWPTMEAAYQVCQEFKFPAKCAWFRRIARRTTWRVTRSRRTNSAARHHRRRGRRGASARHGREPHAVACHWRASGEQKFERLGFASFHCANARRHSGCDGRHWRRTQCRVARNFDTRSWRYQAQREGDSFQKGIIGCIARTEPEVGSEPEKMRQYSSFDPMLPGGSFNKFDCVEIVSTFASERCQQKVE